MRVPAAAVLAGSLRRLPHDAVVVRQGEPSSTFYVVERGAIRLSRVTPEGREVVTTLLPPGGVFGEAAVLGEPSPVHARAVGPTIIVGFGVDRLPLIVQDDPRTGSELVRMLAARLHATDGLLGHVLATDLLGRVELRLRELAETHGTAVPGGTQIAIPLTQEELARMVGASREAVNRSLRTLTARGDVRWSARAIVLSDRDARTAAS